MKQILGLDLGVSSVGWALIRENETGNRDIIKMGVRIVPEDPNFHGKFYEGNTASKNADRRTKRGIRRNNQRFKLRRDGLKEILEENGMYPDDGLLIEVDKLELHKLRSDALERKLSLEEIGRVLIHMNHNRGFLSNRKAQTEEDNSTEYKKQLTENEAELQGRTIGQYKYQQLLDDPHARLKDKVYLRKTYIEEFDRIWEEQRKYHNNVLTGGPDDASPDSLYYRLKNETIFYQRPLKSQKHLKGHCQFEKHHRVVPKSSPLFQSFRVYQQVNNLKVTPYGEYKGLELNKQQRSELIKLLLSPDELNKKGNASRTKVLSLLGYKKGSLNYEELIGDQTKKVLYDALTEAGVEAPDRYLNLDPTDKTDQGYMHLWHVLYSLERTEDVIKALVKYFDLSHYQAEVVARKVAFPSDYGSLSARAIRKLLPFLKEGMTYDKACEAAGYDHSGYRTEVELNSHMELVKPNELRNPVVEQVLNQMINVVNALVDKYGRMDEVVVEMARELKNNAKTRKRISSSISKNKKVNDGIRDKLKEEFGYAMVNGRDVKRYKLWQETNGECLYCLNNISQADLLNGNADIEHIIPRSRSFNDSLQNKIITHVKCNRDKGQMTALDYMMTQGESKLEAYHNEVQRLYDSNEISVIKYKNLLTPGSDVGSGFLSRQMKDTQYVVTEAVRRLKAISPSVRTTTGSVTDLLRDQWELNHVLQELVLPKYQKIGAVEKRRFKDGVNGVKEFTIPKDWSKRDDHRHHAVDALIVALTTPSMIFRLNNLNKIFQYKNDRLSKEGKEEMLKAWKEMGLPAEGFDLKSFSLSESLKFEPPVPDFRDKAKMHLANALISFKKRSKAVSPKINRFKTGKGEHEQRTLVPRGSLHNDTIHGKIKVPEKVKLSTRFDRIDDVIDPAVKGVLEERIRKYGGTKKAFSSSTLKKDPVIISGDTINEVDVHRYIFTKRVPVSQLTAAQIKKIVDVRIRSLVEGRVNEKGSLKKALDSCEQEPIFIDRHRKIPVRSVTVSDEGDLVAVREVDGDPVDYVYTAGNHHVRIYKNEEGKYVDKVVSFWDAVTNVSQKYDETGQLTSPIERRDLPEEGLQFVYDLQKNDLVVIDLDLTGLDIHNPENWSVISAHLFRVQKFSKNKRGEFAIEFRHHLESSLNRSAKELRGITWERFQSNGNFNRLCKLQVNNLGEIIAVHYP